MLKDESLDNNATLKLEKLNDSFEAAWKEWRKDSVDKEKMAYRAFVNAMVFMPPEQEKRLNIVNKVILILKKINIVNKILLMRKCTCFVV